MPEIYMSIEWPTGRKDFVYSPSTIIQKFFEPKTEMSVAEFKEKVVEALNAASDRVVQVYGFECTSSRMEMQRICKIVENFEDLQAPIKILTV